MSEAGEVKFGRCSKEIHGWRDVKIVGKGNLGRLLGEETGGKIGSAVYWGRSKVICGAVCRQGEVERQSVLVAGTIDYFNSHSCFARFTGPFGIS